jgi:8-oxo-dGTP pyrophosphatase MutT (NUDIX family)
MIEVLANGYGSMALVKETLVNGYSWYYMQTHNAVGALVKKGDYFYLTRQNRTPIHRSILEIVCGGMKEGEDPSTAMRNEIAEEVGFEVLRMVSIGEYYTAASVMTEKFHLFYVEIGDYIGQNLCEQEIIDKLTIEKFTLEELKAMIKKREITEAFLITALYYYENVLEDKDKDS